MIRPTLSSCATRTSERKWRWTCGAARTADQAEAASERAPPTGSTLLRSKEQQRIL